MQPKYVYSKQGKNNGAGKEAGREGRKRGIADMCQLQYLCSEFVLLNSLKIPETLGASVKTDPRQLHFTW